MVHIPEPRFQRPGDEKPLGPKIEMNGSIAGFFILTSVFLLLMREISGAPAHPWHQWFYAPALCAVPFLARVAFLVWRWWRARRYGVLPMAGR